MITNAAFLSTVFSKTPPGASAWVTGFAEDPHAPIPGAGMAGPSLGFCPGSSNRIPITSS